MDEDCLLLSIYSPPDHSATEEKLPVVVWIHGGSLVTGCGMFPFYGPDRIMKVQNYEYSSILQACVLQN